MRYFLRQNSKNQTGYYESWSFIIIIAQNGGDIQGRSVAEIFGYA